ncbi:MAG: response regulator [Flavipsychrobacter sp.]|nr:response regulator [Flavipsychrobacter sp.]
MNKTGPIIVIEDDEDDQEILMEVFKKIAIPNKVFYFADGNEALEFLNKTDIQPFMILSDINMPRINGFELRNKVFADKQLATKCIPYLFFTTSSNKNAVLEAYALSVQGFFIKPTSVNTLESMVRKIIDYWQICIAPNEF